MLIAVILLFRLILQVIKLRLNFLFSPAHSCAENVVTCSNPIYLSFHLPAMFVDDVKIGFKFSQ